jgi:GNAT superfamily N-acetyltransferase
MDIQHLDFLDTADISRAYADKLLANVKHVEKKSFPAIEAFNFDTELRSATLILCAQWKSTKIQRKMLSHYVYCLRPDEENRAATQICVLQQHRGQGIGKQMMAWLLVELAKKGCERSAMG